MNRLQKKCFLASTGVHVLLLLILLVGPAFLAPKTRSDNQDVIDFIPSQFVDGQSGGGNRNAKPPPAVKPQPPAPTPVVAQAVPQKAHELDPPKITPRQERLDPDSFEAEPKPHKPQVSMKMVTRPNAHSKTKEKPADTESQTQKLFDARRQLAKQLASAAQSIREGTSSATTIEEYGPGTGGPAYANYAAWVKTVYENAWELPEDTATDDAITKVMGPFFHRASPESRVIQLSIARCSGRWTG
jgi:hypothetical protein